MPISTFSRYPYLLDYRSTHISYLHVNVNNHSVKLTLPDPGSQYMAEVAKPVLCMRRI